MRFSPGKKKKSKLGFSPQSINESIRKSRQEKPKAPKKKPKPKPSPGRRERRERKAAPPRKEYRYDDTSRDNSELFRAIGSAIDYLQARGQRRLEREKQLDCTVLKLASEQNGLLAAPILVELGISSREAAMASFARHSRAGNCRYLCEYKEESVYVFPSLVPRVWECVYCDSQFEVEEHHNHETKCSCVNCGAKLKLTVAD